MKMTRIYSIGGSGWVEIVKEDKGSSKDVYVTAFEHGASLSLVEVQDVILALAKIAGFKTEPTGNNMGVIIQFPPSPAVFERREELAQKFYDKEYDNVPAGGQYAIEYIIEGEIKRGELR
jgi:hypothetical protein